ncbi:hypothetical protein B0H11DRAFT_1940957 [Mycena galericulata]|nr:hypothetical protein B0H11DRAFT_1940957 [Mycena galericulata]
MLLTVNNVPCGGANNIHDGCQRIFIYSDPSRPLCFKCEKLSVPTLSDKDREDIEACHKCSITGKRVSDPCGSCDRRYLEEQGLEDPVKEAARLLRLQKAQTMFGTGKPLVEVTNHPVGPTTSARELSEIRLTNKSALWTLVYQVRVDKQVDSRFGTQSYSADADEALDRVLLGMLEAINIKWIKIDGHFLELTAKHCELSFKNNFRITPEAQTLTVKSLFQFYAARSDRALALGPDNNKNRKGLAKGTYMEMEVIVSTEEYERTVNHMQILNNPALDNEDEDDVQEGSTKRKKKATANPANKRPNVQVTVLTSSFAPRATYYVAVPTDF